MSSEPELDETRFRARFLAALNRKDLPGDVLARHAWRVREHNRHVNLTRITNPEAMAIRHVLDSLAAEEILAEIAPAHVLDLGTGAGWPGLPLALVAREPAFTLLDGTRKKIEFLERLIEELALQDQVSCVWNRFESYTRSPDLVLLRAVGPLPRVLGWLPNGFAGRLLLWKGPGWETELDDSRRALRKARMKLEHTISYRLPNDEVERHLVLLTPGMG